MTEFPHLRQPAKIGPMTVRNRIVDPAKTLFYSTDYVLSDRHLAFYRERARGGAGLIITEQQAAHPTGKGSFFRSCTAWEPRAIPRYQKLVEVVHEHGSRVVIQLYTPGVQDTGTMIMDDWRPVWGASSVVSSIHRAMPMIMTKDHIKSLVDGYATSASNVLAAGVDGIEIHAAHGYQLAQFLSPWYNRRDDEYGGTPENRCRLLLEVAQAVRSVVGDRMAVGVRMSYDEFRGPSGVTADESDEQIDRMNATGLFDFFNITGGGYGNFNLSLGSMRTPQGHMAEFGRRAKKIVGDGAAVFIVGRIKSIEMAEQLVGDGYADLVCMSRAQLTDPFLVDKALTGRSDEIRRCVGINRCVARLTEQREVICALTPATGREEAWGHGSIRPLSKPDRKRVLVAGAGPAGLRVAALLAARGHRVSLHEAEGVVGGHIRTTAKLPTRSEWLEAVEDLEREAVRNGAEIRLDSPVNEDVVTTSGADILIMATGSRWSQSGFSPLRPDKGVPSGLTGRATMAIDSAVEREIGAPGALGNRVVIVDETGGYLPFGLAELLLERGAQVQIVTPHLASADEMVKTQELNDVMPVLRRGGVMVRTELALDRAEGDSVVFRDIWAGADVVIEDVTTLVLATHREPVRVTSLSRKATGSVIMIGDALAPRDIAEVLYEAEKVGRTF